MTMFLRREPSQPIPLGKANQYSVQLSRPSDERVAIRLKGDYATDTVESKFFDIFFLLSMNSCATFHSLKRYFLRSETSIWSRQVAIAIAVGFLFKTLIFRNLDQAEGKFLNNHSFILPHSNVFYILLYYLQKSISPSMSSLITITEKLLIFSCL